MDTFALLYSLNLSNHKANLLRQMFFKGAALRSAACFNLSVAHCVHFKVSGVARMILIVMTFLNTAFYLCCLCVHIDHLPNRIVSTGKKIMTYQTKEKSGDSVPREGT
ncbi:MAG: hypothetical protein H6Q60_1412 [Oscillospiraceae bacterium]|nr:hypothetical protein [Oscillospiraceae bacterium]